MRPRLGALLGGLTGVAGCALLAGCGQSAPAGADWRGAHPDPSGYSFLEQGQLGGVCAISVHYPEEAPSAISHGGNLYLQRRRTPVGSVGGTEAVLARSGDWSLRSSGNGGLALLTAASRYEYDLNSNC